MLRYQPIVYCPRSMLSCILQQARSACSRAMAGTRPCTACRRWPPAASPSPCASEGVLPKLLPTNSVASRDFAAVGWMVLEGTLAGTQLQRSTTPHQTHPPIPQPGSDRTTSQRYCGSGSSMSGCMARWTPPNWRRTEPLLGVLGLLWSPMQPVQRGKLPYHNWSATVRWAAALPIAGCRQTRDNCCTWS